MAIHFEANYSKKLGLPNYSSHQYSVTIKTEVSDPNQVAAESTRLYDLLQSCVDREIQKTGFLPEAKSATAQIMATSATKTGGVTSRSTNEIRGLIHVSAAESRNRIRAWFGAGFRRWRDGRRVAGRRRSDWCHGH